METILNQCRRTCYKKVFSAETTREESVESVVPDVLPDIAQILNTDGFVLLRSKEVDDGRITLGAAVQACVLYCPDGESGVRRLAVTLPVTVTLDAPGVTENSLPVASLRLVSIDARMLNPRKVLVRAEVLVCAACYDAAELSFCDRIAENAGDIQSLPGRVSYTPTRLVREKTFVMTDRYTIALAQPPIGELLRYRVELLPDECKFAGTKYMVKGAARVMLLYAAPESGEVNAAEFESGLSQVIELDGVGETADAQVCLMLTGAFLEPLGGEEQREVSIELHLVAQVVCTERCENAYLEDAYSNSCELALTRTQMTIEDVRRCQCLRETLREMLETPEPVREVVHACCRMGSPSVSGGRIQCPVTVSVLYRGQSDALGCVTRQLKAETNVDPGGELCIEVQQAYVCQCQAAATAAGIELRIPVEFAVCITQCKTIQPITGICSGEARQGGEPHPSVTLVTAENGESLWTLAKRYASTISQIAQANGIEENADVSGRLLLVPSVR